MTRKDFVVLAEEIRNMLDSTQRLNAAAAVASACKRLNPRFDVQKFYVACGIVK
jgi:hypothetical protein